jgi:S-adenosylmethionine:diacylglycerol 3-amino-3-carboxypropyl transferase
VNAASDNPWTRGRFDAGSGPRMLLFGSMYEDPAIERAAFAPGARVFCIASAGDMALALCDDHPVTTVDINPVQVEYARSRLAGGPRRVGAAERLMGFGRGLMPLLGWTASRVERFLALDDVAEQQRCFAAELDTWRFRAAVDAAFSLTALARVYGSELMTVVPPRFGAVMRARLARCIARHPNRGNPWLRLLLTGARGDDGALPAAAARIELSCADAVDALSDGPPARFDAFTLSNVFDGAGQAFAERLRRAVHHAAAPGAVVVRRSFREPGAGDDARYSRAAEDRSVLWGVVDVRPVAEWT